MMANEFDTAFAQLRRTADKLAELVVWQELDDEHARRNVPPGFRVNHHLQEDARSLYGLFLLMDQLLRQALSRPDHTHDWEFKTHWRKTLTDIEDRVRKLRIPERFINP
jgi:hypothetical protein